MSLTSKPLFGVNSPHPVKLSLADFVIQLDQEGKPVQVTCPQKQQVPLRQGRLNGYLVGLLRSDHLPGLSIPAGRAMSNPVQEAIET
jgi:hypothetical protein